MDYKGMDFADFVSAIYKEKNDIWGKLTQFKKENPILPDNAVIDENQTVVWNREEVKRRNRSIKAKIGAFKSRYNQVAEKAEKEIIRRIKEDSGFGDNLARLVYERAYEHSHSEGYAAIYNTAYDLVDFVQQVLDLTT